MSSSRTRTSERTSSREIGSGVRRGSWKLSMTTCSTAGKGGRRVVIEREIIENYRKRRVDFIRLWERLSQFVVKSKTGNQWDRVLLAARVPSPSRFISLLQFLSSREYNAYRGPPCRHLLDFRSFSARREVLDTQSLQSTHYPAANVALET